MHGTPTGVRLTVHHLLVRNYTKSSTASVSAQWLASRRMFLTPNDTVPASTLSLPILPNQSATWNPALHWDFRTTYKFYVLYVSLSYLLIPCATIHPPNISNGILPAPFAIILTSVKHQPKLGTV